ncbi:MAG: radical SAM protein [Thermodesulforhabdaceae bacterium]|jgi:putative pyruvate formate lyase activating enzyme
MIPLYRDAYAKGVLKERVERALSWMTKCTLCPRMCKVNRLENQKGRCLLGRYAVVASYGPHFGEESPLVGRNGSGTIFFAGCNLGCIFCQNYDISHTSDGYVVSPAQLAEIMLELQRMGCHNINFVTPSHVIPQILESLPYAVEKGLNVPLVYNSSGYDRVAALKLLDGIVDIYMPDFKFWDPALSKRWCDADDYPDRARSALKEMHRQVGDLIIEDGIAVRGLLVRHLVMPGFLEDTRQILKFIAEEISPNTYINVMDQYRPMGELLEKREWDEIDRNLLRMLRHDEYLAALRMAQEFGLYRIDDRRSIFKWLFRER